MGNNSNINIPHFDSVELLVDKFSNFYITKTTIIRNKIIAEFLNNTCYVAMEIIFHRIICKMIGPASEVEIRSKITSLRIIQMTWIHFQLGY